MNQHTQRLYQQMKKRLDKVVPDAELRLKAEIAAEILKLKKEKNALILAHNYMEPALFYSIPDYCGDSQGHVAGFFSRWSLGSPAPAFN